MAKLNTPVGVVEYDDKTDWRILKSPSYNALKGSAEKVVQEDNTTYLKFGDYALMFTSGDNYVGDWDTEMDLLKNPPVPKISGTSSAFKRL